MRHSLFSLAGMKVVARSIGQDPHLPMEAVRNGLRESSEDPFSLSGYSLAAPVIWVSGTTGSGKSEMTHALQRNVVASGYRAITICADDQWIWRWHKSERNVVDLRAEEVLPDLGRQAGDQTMVIVPDLSWSVDVLEKVSAGPLARLLDGVKSDTLITLRGVDHLMMADPTLINTLRALSLRSGVRILIETRKGLTSQDSPALITDDQVQGFHSDISTIPGGPALPLRNLEFALRQRGCWVLVEPGYQFDLDPEPAAGPLAINVGRRLHDALTCFPAGTHIQRLEMVARACGFRSWHAAQGHLRQR